MSSPTQAQFLGALFGGAIGDALGAPFSGRPSVKVALGAPGDLEYARLPAYPLGQTTDETQMTLAVARSIARTGGVDGKDMAQELQRLWETGQVLGARPTCTRAIETMQAGDAPWYGARVPAPCADVGSVGRVAPIGLWRAEHTRDLVRDALLCSSLTHGDDRAGAGAVAVARAVAFMGTHEDIVPERCLYRVGIAAGQVLPPFADWVVDLGELLNESPPDAADAIRQIGVPEVSGDDDQPLWSNVVHVVLWALYCALHTPHSFPRAVHTAISAGGETDVSGALVGTLVGAHVGVAGLPARLLETLWGGEEIRETALALFAAYQAAAAATD